MSLVNSGSDSAKILYVAALQLALRAGQEEYNLNRVGEAAERLARDDRFDLLVLPECFNGVFDDQARGPSRRAGRFLSELARCHRACIVGGSMERRSADGKIFNSTLIFDARGNQVGVYDKRVLFGQESRRREAGQHPGRVFELGGWRVGVLICADLWYPELARGMCGRVDLFCVPAETAVPTPEHVAYARSTWFSLAMTRAQENAVPVVVSDWAVTQLCPGPGPLVGGEQGSYFTSGASTIVDPSVRPDLERMQGTLAEGGEGRLSAPLDLERVREFRAYRRSVGLLPAGTDS